MKVMLSSSTSHSVAMASSLSQIGYKVTFSTRFLLNKRPKYFDLLPQKLRKKIGNRIFPELRDVRIKNSLAAEIIERLLIYLPFISQNLRFEIENILMDLNTTRMLDNSYDVLHVVQGSGVFSVSKAKRLDINVVVERRDNCYLFNQKTLSGPYKRMGESYTSPIPSKKRAMSELSTADLIIVPSELSKKTYVENGIEERKINVLNLATDTNFFKPQDQKRTENIKILSVGTINITKGIHILNEATKYLSDLQYEILLTGKQTSFSKKHINSEKIKFLGHLNKSELPRIFNSSDIFVHPSLSDSWAFVVIEAMACGLPVIVTENTGAKDAVIDNANGYIIPIENPKILAEKLRQLIQDEVLRKSMGIKSRESALQFSYSKYSQKVKELYKILDNRNWQDH